MNNLLIDTVGWIGAIALLVAYGLISAEKIKSKSRFYQGLNLVGSVGLIVNTVYYGAYPSTFVNVIWLGIAVAALVAVGRRAEVGSGTSSTDD